MEVKNDFSLISANVVFTFNFLGSKDFSIKLISIILYIPGDNVHPLVDPAINLTSTLSTISCYVNCILWTIPSKSLYFAVLNSAIISHLK